MSLVLFSSQFYHDYINSIKCKVFADDTKIYISSINNSIIQKGLDELQKLSEIWQLPFNTDKCKCMCFGKNNPRHSYHLNNFILQEYSEQSSLTRSMQQE